MNKKEQKWAQIAACFVCDLTIAAWFYIYAKNITYPNSLQESEGNNIYAFDGQIYFIFLQSLIIFIAAFLFGQIIAYLFAMRNNMSAFFYLKYYSVMAVVISGWITFKFNPFALLPLVVYLSGYYIFARSFKECRELQTQKTHLSTKPQ